MTTVPVVLVHGNPETPAIWWELTPHLGDRRVITPRLPGFGEPAPDDFGATRTDYVNWLIGELEAIGEPVDLVGHDWGGGIVVPVACERPDLIRSWASDVMGLFDAGYVWHDMAQVWQTPEAGEGAVAMINGFTLDERTAMMGDLGMPPLVAADVAGALGDELGRCMLALYRSAAQPAMADYAAAHLDAASARPGLAIIPSDDPYTGGIEMAQRAAAVAGADPVVLDGLGHWWMLQDPARGASILIDFWSSLTAP